MTTLGKVVPIVVVLAAAGAIYPSAHGAYVRHRASAHLEEAAQLRTSLKSPVGAQSLEGAMSALRLALRGNAADTAALVKIDRALVDVMHNLRTNPPPEQAVIVTAQYDATIAAGATLPVAITITPQVTEIFVVSVAAEVGADRGWRTGPVRSAIGHAVRADQPANARIDIPIPPGASGMGTVAVTLIYRIDPTGEGPDLVERPASLPAISIRPPFQGALCDASWARQHFCS